MVYLSYYCLTVQFFRYKTVKKLISKCSGANSKEKASIRLLKHSCKNVSSIYNGRYQAPDCVSLIFAILKFIDILLIKTSDNEIFNVQPYISRIPFTLELASLAIATGLNGLALKPHDLCSSAHNLEYIMYGKHGLRILSSDWLIYTGLSLIADTDKEYSWKHCFFSGWDYGSRQIDYVIKLKHNSRQKLSPYHWDWRKTSILLNIPCKDQKHPIQVYYKSQDNCFKKKKSEPILQTTNKLQNNKVEMELSKIHSPENSYPNTGISKQAGASILNFEIAEFSENQDDDISTIIKKEPPRKRLFRALSNIVNLILVGMYLVCSVLWSILMSYIFSPILYLFTRQRKHSCNGANRLQRLPEDEHLESVTFSVLLSALSLCVLQQKNDDNGIINLMIEAVHVTAEWISMDKLGVIAGETRNLTRSDFSTSVNVLKKKIALIDSSLNNVIKSELNSSQSDELMSETDSSTECNSNNSNGKAQIDSKVKKQINIISEKLTTSKRSDELKLQNLLGDKLSKYQLYIKKNESGSNGTNAYSACDKVVEIAENKVNVKNIRCQEYLCTELRIDKNICPFRIKEPKSINHRITLETQVALFVAVSVLAKRNLLLNNYEEFYKDLSTLLTWYPVIVAMHSVYITMLSEF